ncbi:MAG: Transcriptional regulator, IclR family, partial [uncultured Nocardioides sp.]
WTTLAESACSTRRPWCSRRSRPDRPPWPVSSPAPGWPAPPPTGSRWRWSTTASSRATCRVGSSSAPAWPSSPQRPARTGCSPPRGPSWPACATSPASRPSCGADRGRTACASLRPSVPRGCATRSPSAPSSPCGPAPRPRCCSPGRIPSACTAGCRTRRTPPPRCPGSDVAAGRSPSVSANRAWRRSRPRCVRPAARSSPRSPSPVRSSACRASLAGCTPRRSWPPPSASRSPCVAPPPT